MKKFLSILLILLGILGMMIPFFPGWIFVLIGLTLISRNLYLVKSK